MNDEFIKLFEKMNEGIPSEDLLSLFDEMYRIDYFREQAVGNEEVEEVAVTAFIDLESKIKLARSKLEEFVKRGISENFPTLWWEGSDGWNMMIEGDLSGIEEYLDEIINFGTRE